MCQIKNIKGDICIDSKNRVFFLSDPHNLHTFKTVTKNISFSRFTSYMVFLSEIGAVQNKVTSRCSIEVLQGLYSEFEKMKFSEAFAEMLMKLGIIPTPPKFQFPQPEKPKNWLQKFLNL